MLITTCYYYNSIPTNYCRILKTLLSSFSCLYTCTALQAGYLIFKREQRLKNTY